jgi:RND family efflux transporter MFP subunit
VSFIKAFSTANQHLYNACSPGAGTAYLCAVFSLVLPGITLPDEVDWPFETSKATVETISVERHLDGKVQAVHQATVSSQTSGRIAEVNFDVDDFANAGSVLIRFTDVEQQTGLRQAEALLKETRARLVEAEEDYGRTQNLEQRGLGSQRDLDRSLATKEAAEARVSAALSAVQAAQQQVEYTLVRAPYAGIVTERHVEVGESVSSGQQLMSGISLEQLRVVVDLPQQLAQLVRNDPKAEVLVNGDRVIPGKITIFPLADPVTNTFKVRLELPPGQSGLYPGMFVKVAFLVSESMRLLIPVSAVIHRSEVTAVYVVSNRGVRLRQIRVGQQFGGRTEVLAGLKDGEMVALDPVAAGIFTKTRETEPRP